MGYVIDAITNKILIKRKSHKVIVYKDENYVEFGYVSSIVGLPYYKYNDLRYPIVKKDMKNVVFCKRTGEYLIDTDDPDVEFNVNVYGCGRFPYTIAREYGADKHIDLFNSSIQDVKNVNYEYSKYLKYSFGLEFETAGGYVPETDCFKLGLIPLRDGSISGVEYSTIPMSGNDGLNRLKAQLDCLKKYTITNKECSVHIHFGGFPVNKKSIFTLHQLWALKYQHLFRDIIPNNSYNTNYFKANGKNYCGETPSFNNFNQLYKYYVGCNYMGDLYQPHPCDVEKKAKWNIKTRYYNCNFINLLCYKGAKTLEFRFLTPTYSFEKLTTFIMLFNMMLLEAEKLAKTIIEANINSHIENDHFSLQRTVSENYPTDVTNKILCNMKKLIWLKHSQECAGDFCGSRLDIEYKFFPDGQ